QAARLVVDVREERGSLALGDLGAARRREARVRGQRVDEALVRVEGVPVREHLVELRLGDDEAGRGAGVARPARLARVGRAAAARALGAPHAPLAGGAGRLALRPPAGLPVLAAVRDDGAAEVDGARAPRRRARRGVRLAGGTGHRPGERSHKREQNGQEQGGRAGRGPQGHGGRRGGGRRGSGVHRCTFRRGSGRVEPGRGAPAWTTPVRGTPKAWERAVRSRRDVRPVRARRRRSRRAGLTHRATGARVAPTRKRFQAERRRKSGNDSRPRTSTTRWTTVTSSRATLIQVAQRAGVSLASTSRAMHGTGASTAMLERVRAAATELVYSPDAIVRSLRLKKTFQVAFAVADIGNPVYVEMMTAIHEVLAPHGYRVVVMTTGDTTTSTAELVRSLSSGFVDAMILSPLRTDDAL